jgi:hypothetical protein
MENIVVSVKPYFRKGNNMLTVKQAADVCGVMFIFESMADDLHWEGHTVLAGEVEQLVHNNEVCSRVDELMKAVYEYILQQCVDKDGMLPEEELD